MTEVLPCQIMKGGAAHLSHKRVWGEGTLCTFSCERTHHVVVARSAG